MANKDQLRTLGAKHSSAWQSSWPQQQFGGDHGNQHATSCPCPSRTRTDQHHSSHQLVREIGHWSSVPWRNELDLLHLFGQIHLSQAVACLFSHCQHHVSFAEGTLFMPKDCAVWWNSSQPGSGTSLLPSSASRFLRWRNSIHAEGLRRFLLVTFLTTSHFIQLCFASIPFLLMWLTDHYHHKVGQNEWWWLDITTRRSSAPTQASTRWRYLTLTAFCWSTCPQETGSPQDRRISSRYVWKQMNEVWICVAEFGKIAFEIGKTFVIFLFVRTPFVQNLWSWEVGRTWNPVKIFIPSRWSAPSKPHARTGKCK